MKTLWLILLLPTLLFAQLTGAEYIITLSPALTVNMFGATADTIYILFPDGDGNWYISEILPTRYLWVSGATEKDRNHNVWCSGDVDLFIQPDTMVTTNNANKDSLFAFIQPLTYDPVDREYAVILSDHTHIKFGAVGTYSTASQEYLATWASGAEYHCLLTGELWPCPGFMLVLDRATEASTDSISINIWSYMSRQNK
jgi:hypothetical protein